MHATSLILSHWDASVPISIPENVVEDLQNYHIIGVRFLYDCFRKMQKGAILNYEDGMNYPIIISGFFNALHTFITPQSPVLIVCTEESLNAWHYHLINHGGFPVITFLSTKNCEEILNGEIHRVILSTLDNAKLLREIKESDFFAVVVEELDKVATKLIIKQLKSQFNIGLTNRNFLKNPDQKLFWTMLKWSNLDSVGKFDEFCEQDTDHLENFRYPYGKWWQRLTWKFCESFKKPSSEDEKQYKKKIQQWCAKNNNYTFLKQEVKRQTRKRKLEENVIIKAETKEKSDKNDSQETIKSEETIIYEDYNCSQNTLDLEFETIIFKNSPSNDYDDSPILTSILGSFKDDNNIKEEKQSLENNDEEQSSNSRKNEILSLLYGDDD